VYVVSAPLARVRPAASVAVILGFPLALLASATVGIAAVLQPLQASVLIGIVSVEVVYCVSLHRFFTSYAGILPEAIPTVKG
jgi:hypothetical protein